MTIIAVKEALAMPLGCMSGRPISYSEVYDKLSLAKIHYPNIKDWFYNKVVPDLISRKRKLIIEIENNDIAGLAIAKVSDERKLCSFIVDYSYYNSGIEIDLFEASFDVLDTNLPFLTIAEERYKVMKKTFDYFGFKLTSIHKNLYRYGKSELFFNEFNK